MRVVSLFSGAGGLDLGFVMAGHQIVWANDIDKDAVATYKRNIGQHIICADIKDIAIRTIPQADIVIGGFPCQGFSVANTKRNEHDKRNTLYQHLVRIIKEKQPKFFLAENVKGILSLGKGEAIRQILSDFQEAGYITTMKLINMADYGVPQTRQRLFIVGQRTNLGDTLRFQFPKQTHAKNGILPKWKSIKEAIEHFPNPDVENNVPNHIYSTYKVSYRNFTAHRMTDPNKPSPTILARGNGKGGVCAIPHYNGIRRLSIRESACIQTFPDDFYFEGKMNSCYRQVGNAVPVHFSKMLGDIFRLIEND